MDRERLVDEILMLMPVLMRSIGRPDPVEMGRIGSRGVPVEVHVSPGHVQILIALSRGPHSAGQLAEVLGVTRPAATQLVDKLVEHGMVERRHDPQDRRVVLVDYVPGMQDIARRITETRRRRLAAALEPLTDEEARAFLKGLRTVTESFGAGEEN